MSGDMTKRDYRLLFGRPGGAEMVLDYLPAFLPVEEGFESARDSSMRRTCCGDGGRKGLFVEEKSVASRSWKSRETDSSLDLPERTVRW